MSTAVSTRAVRRVVVAVCTLGIAGMIAASIADNTGAALTFGLLTSTAVVCLVVATAVTRPTGTTPSGRPAGRPEEAQAELVEELVARMVATGADERELRVLVREAVRLGRGERP